MAHNHGRTDGHGDSMTESAQWGRFSENQINIIKLKDQNDKKETISPAV